jgi:RNA polymerase-interacting CarD/CdnL/TRCF family regulator
MVGNPPMAKGLEIPIGDSALHVGDRVVYPNQGICTITGVEVKQISGYSLEMVTLSRVEDGATVMVARNKIAGIGLRKVASPELIDEMFDLLASPSDDPQLDWKVRHRENADRMTGGGLFGTAEVLKGLQVLSRLRPLPPKERELYDNARHQLVSEIAAACDLPSHVAEDSLDYALFPPTGMMRKGHALKPMQAAPIALRPVGRGAAGKEDLGDDLGEDLGEELAEEAGDEAAVAAAPVRAGGRPAAGRGLRAVEVDEEDEPEEDLGDGDEPLDGGAETGAPQTAAQKAAAQKSAAQKTAASKAEAPKAAKARKSAGALAGKGKRPALHAVADEEEQERPAKSKPAPKPAAKAASQGASKAPSKVAGKGATKAAPKPPGTAIGAATPGPKAPAKRAESKPAGKESPKVKR